MSSGSKVVLGIFTFLPMILGICFLVGYLLFIKDVILNLDPNTDPQYFAKYFLSHILSPGAIAGFIGYIILHFSLLIWYIAHVVRNGTKTEGEKVMWILLFIFIGSLGNIIYFLVRILPYTSSKQATAIS